MASHLGLLLWASVSGLWLMMALVSWRGSRNEFTNTNNQCQSYFSVLTLVYLQLMAYQNKQGGVSAASRLPTHGAAVVEWAEGLR